MWHTRPECYAKQKFNFNSINHAWLPPIMAIGSSRTTSASASDKRQQTADRRQPGHWQRQENWEPPVPVDSPVQSTFTVRLLSLACNCFRSRSRFLFTTLHILLSNLLIYSSRCGPEHNGGGGGNGNETCPMTDGRQARAQRKYQTEKILQISHRPELRLKDTRHANRKTLELKDE